MKHKKKKEREVKRNWIDGYLYKSMTKGPTKGRVIFPINNDRRLAYFIKDGGTTKDALKVEYEEGRVSYDGTVWFMAVATRRDLQTAYSEYNKRIGSFAKNGSLTRRVSSSDYGLGTI